MKNVVFYKAFYFARYTYDRYHYTDARDGASRHYIGLLEKGHCRIVSGAGTIEAGPGEPFYIPMDLSYQSYWFSDEKIVLISCGFDFFPEMDTNRFKLQKLPAQLADMIRQIPLMGEPDSKALGALFAALGQALPAMERINEPSGCPFVRAVDYMQQHSQCSAAETARACGVSESALYASFKRHGTTPNQVRQDILVRQARMLLTTTDMSIQEISDQLGFSSTSYFRKILFRQTGKTPTQIRREVLSV